MCSLRSRKRLDLEIAHTVISRHDVTGLPNQALTRLNDVDHPQSSSRKQELQSRL